MSTTRILILKCDHRDPRVPTESEPTADRVCRRLFIPGEEGLAQVQLRELAGNRGWKRYVTPSRHEYDLCDDHAHRRPGIDFPHWKAEVAAPRPEPAEAR